MLAAWALKNWKAVAAVFAVVALLALAGFGFWRGLVAIERLQETAAAAARAERDAHWTAEIARANAAVQQARAEQATVAARADAAARDAEATFQTQLKELEKANAALPAGDRCGLGRDRVRLLNGAKP